MADRYKIISEKDYTNYIFENYPVRIETIRILADNKTQKSLVQIKLINISNEIIDNITLKVAGYDVTDTELVTVDDVSWGALNVKPCEAFGGQNPIEIDDSRVSYAKMYIKRVAFKTGEEWNNTEESMGIEADMKKNIDFSEKLTKELRKCADNYKFQMKCMYEERGNYWRCSCGHINNHTLHKCYYCDAELKVLKQCFSEDYLQKKNEEAEIENKNRIYDLAEQAESFETENKLQEAVGYYNQIKEWKDSEERIELCMRKIEYIKKEREEQIKAEEQRKAMKKKRRKFCYIVSGIVIAIGLVVTISIKEYQKITLNRKLDEIADSLILKNNKIKVGSQIANLIDFFECENGVKYGGVKDWGDLQTDKVGKYTLKVEAIKDELVAEKKVVIEIYDDEAPSISAKDVSIPIDQTFNEYLNVKCIDNSGEDIKLKVIENNVNTSKVGVYKVVYEAKDSSGNIATVERKVTVHKRYNNYKEIKKFVKKLLKKDKYKSLIVTCDDKKELLRVQGKKAFSEKGPSNQWIWNTKPCIGISKESGDNGFSEMIIYISIYAENYNGLVIDNFGIYGPDVGLDFEPLGVASYSNEGTIVNSVAQYYVPEDSIESYRKAITSKSDENWIECNDNDNGTYLSHDFSSKEQKMLKVLDSFYIEMKEYIK